MKFHNKISALAGLIFTLVPFISALINSFIQTPATKSIIVIAFMIAWSLLAYFILSLPYKELRRYHLIDTECNKQFGYHLITYEIDCEISCSVMKIKHSEDNKICCVNFIDFGLDFKPLDEKLSNKKLKWFSSDDFQFVDNGNLQSSISFKDRGIVLFVFTIESEAPDNYIVRRIDENRFSKNAIVISGNSRMFDRTDFTKAQILTDDEGKISKHEWQRFKKCKLNDDEVSRLVKAVMSKGSKSVKDKNKSTSTPVPPPGPPPHTHISTLDKAADKGTESMSELFETINKPIEIPPVGPPPTPI
ncbi:MAG: hypothetical protein LBM93_03295 [Oscillospiraceae bacterium]|nr:hypothetical protein [Oscillospiraceae bacterium]